MTAIMIFLGCDLVSERSGDGELCGGEVSFGTLLSWVLVTVVQVVVGRRFYRNAYKVRGNPSILLSCVLSMCGPLCALIFEFGCVDVR